MAITRPEVLSSILLQFLLYIQHVHGGDLTLTTMERFAIFLSRFTRFLQEYPHALDIDALCKTVAIILANSQADVSVNCFNFAHRSSDIRLSNPSKLL